MSQATRDAAAITRESAASGVSSLARLQAATGIVLAIFVTLHLLNLLVAIVGPGAYDGFQAAVRPVYQFPLVEALILGSIAVHLVVAITRFLRDPRKVRQGRFRWHRYSGVFLMLVIVGHVAAVRGPSWFADIYPGAQGLAFTLNAYPAYFYPYYFLLACAGFYHALQGTSVAAARFNKRGLRASNERLASLTAGFGVLAILALACLGGLLYEIPDPFDNDAARLFRSIVGGE